jgi:Bacterial Ig-like domain (group 3)
MRKSLCTAIIAVATIVCSGAALVVGVGAASTSGGAATSPQPSSIPVLDWHELNNGCDPTAPVCNAADPESVSTAQLTAELGYLKAQGYKTISPLQYEQWTEGANQRLPTKPVFLVDDNGIENFLAGAQPVLASYGFSMAVAVVTGFADGAKGVCSLPAFQPGCPVANDNGWDATWAQLRAFSPSVYSFIIESGAAGHFVQTYDPTCTAFYACMVAHETVSQYENRVANELAQGEQEIMNKVGAARFTPGMWVVPYSDDGYPACSGNACTSQASDGPAGWLPAWTASRYKVAFVEDAFRNGIQNEHYRIDVQGWMTESEFETMLNQNLVSGYFTRTHTTELPASNVLTNSTNGATVTPGTQLTFTDSVTGSAPEGAPTGTVAWAVGGTAGVTACAGSTANLNAGPATCTVTVTNAGTVKVSASYGGDENYPVGTSNRSTVTAATPPPAPQVTPATPPPAPQVTPAITPSTPNVTPTPNSSTTTGSSNTTSTGTTGTTSATTPSSTPAPTPSNA